MNKKADFSFESLAKLLIAVVVLAFLLIIAWLARDKISSLIDQLKNILRFGR
ncbi:MAG: hypothetical protein KKD48_01135 [Nanoarchaeota archaeon]|nr:hypothetical protein [Nanoarchaeota archaeon]